MTVPASAAPCPPTLVEVLTSRDLVSDGSWVPGSWSPPFIPPPSASSLQRSWPPISLLRSSERQWSWRVLASLPLPGTRGPEPGAHAHTPPSPGSAGARASKVSSLVGFRCTFLLAMPYLCASSILVLAFLNTMFLACF